MSTHWNQDKSKLDRHGEPPDHRAAVMKVIQIMAMDSKLTVLSDFGLSFVSDNHPDYHEYDCAMLSINAQQFKLIGEVLVTLAGKRMSFNEMYKEVELFRKFIDKNVKLIVEVDGERHESIEVRIRDGVTQHVAIKKWDVPEGSMKFIRLKKADCDDVNWVRKRLWGLKI
jgi:hypothetical protein